MFRKKIYGILFSLILSVSLAQADLNQADQKEVNSYRLTESNLTHFEKATSNLARLVHDQPDLAVDIPDKQIVSLNELSGSLDKVPSIKKAIQDQGLSTREFLLFEFAIVQTAFALWAEKQGQKIGPEFSKENLEFYKSHEARFNMLSKDLKIIESLTGDKRDEDDEKDAEEKD